MKKTFVYPAVFHYAEDGISIFFPDLPGCLPCAQNDQEAMKNASEALGLHLYGMEEDGEVFPEPSSLQHIKTKENEFLVLVETFMPAVRAKAKKSFVKKTLSIPADLNAQAERVGINFSQLLQKALLEELDESKVG